MFGSVAYHPILDSALKTHVDGIVENVGNRFSDAEEIFRKAKANDDRIEAKVDKLAAGKD